MARPYLTALLSKFLFRELTDPADKAAIRSDIDAETAGAAATAQALAISTAAGDATAKVAAALSDEAYSATTWNGVATASPTKNAVRDKFVLIDDDLTTATSSATALKLVRRGAAGEALFGTSEGIGVYSNATSTGDGGSFNSSNGTGLIGSSGSGNGAHLTSSGGIGSVSHTSAGTYHARFGTGVDDNRSFVAKLLGAFGWCRGAYTGQIQAAATLTANRTWTLSDATGTIALTSDITAPNITDATSAGRNMLTAADLTAQRTLLGIPTYANLTAANAALTIGQIYFDTALGTLNTATA